MFITTTYLLNCYYLFKVTLQILSTPRTFIGIKIFFSINYGPNPNYPVLLFPQARTSPYYESPKLCVNPQLTYTITVFFKGKTNLGKLIQCFFCIFPSIKSKNFSNSFTKFRTFRE